MTVIALPRKRFSLYGATAGFHPVHPQTIAIDFRILASGGSGMGSRPNMSFGADIADAYAMYGKKGRPSCVGIKATRLCASTDGFTFSWPNHGLEDDHPLFITGSQQIIWYVHGPSKTTNTFMLCLGPYVPPGVTELQQPYNFGGAISLELNPYRHAVLGGNPGAIVGDQPFSGKPIGLYFGDPLYPSSMYWYGGFGEHQLGAGGRGGGGGGPFGGGGAPPQIGGSKGNAGINGQGGGGGGAGFLNLDGSYPINQFGPGGGAGGAAGEGSLAVAPSIAFFAGAGVTGGAAGPGGFEGGDSGHGHVMFIETLAA